MNLAPAGEGEWNGTFLSSSFVVKPFRCLIFYLKIMKHHLYTVCTWYMEMCMCKHTLSHEARVAYIMSCCHALQVVQQCQLYIAV